MTLGTYPQSIPPGLVPANLELLRLAHRFAVLPRPGGLLDQDAVFVEDMLEYDAAVRVRERGHAGG